MLSRLHGKLTFANVVSCLALFFALGGFAVAATHLGKNSVGTNQIKKNAVVTSKIRNGSVTAEKVKSGTLTGTQINASTLGTVPTAQTANTLAAPEAWHEVGASGQPAFLNSWANTSGPIHGETVAFYKDQGGVVHLRGAAMSGTPGAPIFDLPPGFRPGSGAFIRVPVVCSTGIPCEKFSSYLDIVGSSFKIPADEGEVIPPTEATEVWLDGVTFRAGS
jgi:hypothetical protein